MISPAPQSNLLGVGLYTPREAALYAQIPTQTIVRWLFGMGGGQAVLSPQLSEEDKLVTFLDFVQAMSVRSIRLMKKTPLQRIRDAVSAASQEFEIEFPLAARHRIFFLGEEIIINVGDQESKKYLQVTGRHKSNFVLTEVAEFFKENLFFDDVLGLASSYRPFEYKNCGIVMDPTIRFGEPYLPSCGYSAQSLMDAYQSEGGLEPAAKAYSVQVHEVETAVRFYDHILGKSVA